MPTPTEEQKARIDLFLKEYGELVEKHHVDFINFPQYLPDGSGGWKLMLQTTPMDITNSPQKSPFVV